MTRPLPPVPALPAAPDPAFERFARLVRRQLAVPVALVTFVSEDEQVFPGCVGLPEPWQSARRTPLSHSFCQHVVRSAQPLVVTDARTHPLVADNLAIPDLDVIAYAGMPITDATGAVVGSLCAIDGQPRDWTADDLAVLTDLAEACSSELQLRTAQQRAAEAAADAGAATTQARQLLVQSQVNRSREVLALRAGQVGTFDLDLATGALQVDDRLLELSGMDRATFSGRPEDVYAHVHPDDIADVVARVRHAVETQGTYDAEYRISLPGNGHRWVAARGEVVGGEDGPGRLVGVVHDTTARRNTLELAAQTLESMAVGYLAMDADWRVTYLNAEAERLAGYRRGELMGQEFWAAFPATVGSDFETNYRRAAATGEAVAFDAYYPEPLDLWVEVRANPEHGGLALYFTDITDRMRAQQRSDLLAEVTRELNGTLDAEDAVARLARTVVPALADWAVISLVDDSASGSRRGVRDVGWWHPDPGMRTVLEAYTRHRVAALRDSSYLNQARASGRTVVLTAGATEAIRAVSEPGPLHEHLDQLAPESFAILPLRGRGRTVGLMSLFTGAARAPISAADLQVAEDIAGRAGLALDNVRLYRQQRLLSEGLQRSLLTAPAEPDHVQIVVRYTPAAEAAQVGGDWYDAFLQPGGTTVITIGDVLGHDTEAAAAMGQIRSVLRGIAVTTGARPAEILSRVDEAMATLMTSITATAVVMRLEQTEEQAARGLTTLRWSNAGHPPPVVLDPDGTIHTLSGARADLLLGVDHATGRREHEATLGADSIVLLFTDGLVERRDADLDVGQERLEQALADLTRGRSRDDLDLDTLADQLLVRMLPDDVDDDVALIAIRLHPQDRPRPAEAGPNRIPADVAPAPAVIPRAT